MLSSLRLLGSASCAVHAAMLSVARGGAMSREGVPVHVAKLIASPERIYRTKLHVWILVRCM